MRSERVRKLLFEFEHFCRIIEILFAALITPDAETTFEGRASGDGIGLGKRNPMPEEKVVPKMKPVVFAEHHPAIVAIDPHFFPYNSPLVCFSGNSRRHCNYLLLSRRFLMLRGVRGGSFEGK